MRATITLLLSLLIAPLAHAVSPDEPERIQSGYYEQRAGRQAWSGLDLGVSAGTPAGLNVIVGARNHTVSTRFHGMYLGSAYGVQMDFGLEGAQESRHSHVVGVTAGRLNLLGDEWTYGGLIWSMNLERGFFLQSGVTFGVGDFKSPQVLLSLGYLRCLSGSRG